MRIQVEAGILSEPKNASSRTVDLPQRAVEALRTHHKVQAEGLAEKGSYRALDVPDATSCMGLAWVEGNGSKIVQNFVRTVCEVAGGSESDLPSTDP
jgi:hypothetical protein